LKNGIRALGRGPPLPPLGIHGGQLAVMAEGQFSEKNWPLASTVVNTERHLRGGLSQGVARAYPPPVGRPVSLWQPLDWSASSTNAGPQGERPPGAKATFGDGASLRLRPSTQRGNFASS